MLILMMSVNALCLTLRGKVDWIAILNAVAFLSCAAALLLEEVVK